MHVRTPSCCFLAVVGSRFRAGAYRLRVPRASLHAQRPTVLLKLSHATKSAHNTFENVNLEVLQRPLARWSTYTMADNSRAGLPHTLSAACTALTAQSVSRFSSVTDSTLHCLPCEPQPPLSRDRSVPSSQLALSATRSSAAACKRTPPSTRFLLGVYLVTG